MEHILIAIEASEKGITDTPVLHFPIDSPVLHILIDSPVLHFLIDSQTGNRLIMPATHDDRRTPTGDNLCLAAASEHPYNNK